MYGSMMPLLSAALLVGLLPAHGVSQSDRQLPPDSVSTVFVSDTVPGFGAVGGVAIDALGYVYIADFRNAVWRYSPDGDLEKLADGFYGASGNAVGPRGYLYQSSFNGNYVSRISRTGEVETWASEGLSGPVGIAAAPDGTLYVVNCSGGYIARIAPDRTVSDFARSDLMACPNGITFDDRGDLFVVNFNSSKVLKVTPDGNVSEFADIPGAGGNGHIAFTRGAFFVTQFRGHKVFRLLRDGTYDEVAGTGAAGEQDGPALEATFNRPNGIAASPGGGELWVNDLTEGQGLGRGRSVVTMRRIHLLSLSDVLASVDPAADASEIEEAYRAYHAMRAGEDSSAGAVTLGYQWLTAGRIAHGVILFRLNGENFPDDANAQFHLGEAYRYTGRPDEAAEQYRTVLRLDPDHGNAAARLAQVTGG
ncbi:MAG: tetratricopeptide repeat protein [Gemmatimonadetes bacterium]|nr:tetratricopeptide repeat protein [Gemmatimonadota bacterium]